MKNNGSLKGKTALITGATRGIGLAIAKKLAADGANVIVAARTTEPTADAKQTIYTAAKEIEDAGGHSLPCKLDVLNVDEIRSTIEKGVAKFGGIDMVVNNASVASFTTMSDTDIEKLDQIFKSFPRAVFAISKLCHPYLKKSSHAHILNISPPLNLNPMWFKRHMAHTANKYSVSMYTLGMAEEFKEDKIAANSLWPKTYIYATSMEKRGEKAKKYCRSVDIMADAAYAILTKDPASCTGNLYFDEDALKTVGITDFEQYRAEKGILHSPHQPAAPNLACIRVLARDSDSCAVGPSWSKWVKRRLKHTDFKDLIETITSKFGEVIYLSAPLVPTIHAENAVQE